MDFGPRSTEGFEFPRAWLADGGGMLPGSGFVPGRKGRKSVLRRARLAKDGDGDFRLVEEMRTRNFPVRIRLAQMFG